MNSEDQPSASPLATPEQAAVERQALRILAEHGELLAAARQRARELMLAHPLAADPETAGRIDNALDKWLIQLLLQTIGGDLSTPGFIWGTNLDPHRWFGWEFPGSGAGIDCPDNIYRNAGLDGAVHYEVTGRVAANGPAQFTFQLTRHPEGLGFAVNDGSMRDLGALAMLTHRDLDIAADGSFRLTLDDTPAAGRRNHIQLPPGRLYLLVRDSLSDWGQVPNQLAIRRTGGAGLPAPLSDRELAGRTAEWFPGFVDFWLRFNDHFNGNPPVNTLVPPYGRTGAWGCAAACHFQLGDGEALVITLNDAGAEYFGIQMADAWMIAPSPSNHLASYNRTQARANPDGTLSFVLAPTDPGVANWVDSAGLHRGWLFIRWQGLPPGTEVGAAMVPRFAVVNRADLAGAVPGPLAGVDGNERQRERTRRRETWQLRVAGPAG
ncbi:MAG: hypothetical protein WDA10_00640 [Porticoccaceae bacterium]